MKYSAKLLGVIIITVFWHQAAFISYVISDANDANFHAPTEVDNTGLCSMSKMTQTSQTKS